MLTQVLSHFSARATWAVMRRVIASLATSNMIAGEDSAGTLERNIS